MKDSESILESAEGKNLVNKKDAYLVLRNRDFRLYLIGRLSASIGQQMLVMAIGWELYERTHSAVSLLFVGLTQVVPMVLLTLPAGHLARMSLIVKQNETGASVSRFKIKFTNLINPGARASARFNIAMLEC